ncbi:MAG: putative manganese transporter [Elusimicrobiota bacterium]|nr:putative manganese transporter [Elusimicrobiota bacterium]
MTIGILIVSLKHALTITGFVFGMMLLIDYVNILTRGKLDGMVRKRQGYQYIITSFLGVTPGCLGAFMNVSFYIHGVISFGALAGGMIATSGDAAFVMLAEFPRIALILFGLLFLIGIPAAFLIDWFGRSFGLEYGPPECELYRNITEKCECSPLGIKAIAEEFKNITLTRFSLLAVIITYIYVFSAGIIGPQNWDWIRVTALVLLALALFIVVTVDEHYLHEHIWNHIFKKHVGAIFLWSFGILLVLEAGTTFWNIESFVRANMVWVLLLSVIIGIIPDSGPHLIFVMLFSKGMIPFSVLLASSIVQDGHGMLPLLAYSVKDAVKVKLFNVVIGLLIGGGLYLVGF